MQATIARDDRRNRRTQYAASRRRALAYGQWAPGHDAEAVRKHVMWLRNSGMTLPQIAQATAAAGHPVGVATIKALLHGRGSGTAPTSQPRRSTACAILAVRPADVRMSRLRQLRRLSDVLVDVGWSRQELRPFVGPVAAASSLEELDSALRRGIVESALGLCSGLPDSPRLRASVAARVLRITFMAPMDVQERRLAAAALCGSALRLHPDAVAAILGVSERTVRRDLDVR